MKILNLSQLHGLINSEKQRPQSEYDLAMKEVLQRTIALTPENSSFCKSLQGYTFKNQKISKKSISNCLSKQKNYYQGYVQVVAASYFFCEKLKKIRYDLSEELIETTFNELKSYEEIDAFKAILEGLFYEHLSESIATLLVQFLGTELGQVSVLYVKSLPLFALFKLTQHKEIPLIEQILESKISFVFSKKNSMLKSHILYAKEPSLTETLKKIYAELEINYPSISEQLKSVQELEVLDAFLNVTNWTDPDGLLFIEKALPLIFATVGTQETLATLTFFSLSDLIRFERAPHWKSSISPLARIEFISRFETFQNSHLFFEGTIDSYEKMKRVLTQYPEKLLQGKTLNEGFLRLFLSGERHQMVHIEPRMLPIFLEPFPIQYKKKSLLFFNLGLLMDLKKIATNDLDLTQSIEETLEERSLQSTLNESLRNEFMMNQADCLYFAYTFMDLEILIKILQKEPITFDIRTQRLLQNALISANGVNFALASLAYQYEPGFTSIILTALQKVSRAQQQKMFDQILVDGIRHSLVSTFMNDKQCSTSFYSVISARIESNRPWNYSLTNFRFSKDCSFITECNRHPNLLILLQEANISSTSILHSFFQELGLESNYSFTELNESTWKIDQAITLFEEELRLKYEFLMRIKKLPETFTLTWETLSELNQKMEELCWINFSTLYSKTAIPEVSALIHNQTLSLTEKRTSITPLLTHENHIKTISGKKSLTNDKILSMLLSDPTITRLTNLGIHWSEQKSILDNILFLKKISSYSIIGS